MTDQQKPERKVVQIAAMPCGRGGEVKRYNHIVIDLCGEYVSESQQHEDGDWVRYADALAAVSQARADALPERQASEIEKRAALIALGPLFEDCRDAMRDARAERDYDYLYDFWTNIEGTFRRYREMYEHAKQIGAIE